MDPVMRTASRLTVGSDTVTASRRDHSCTLGGGASRTRGDVLLRTRFGFRHDVRCGADRQERRALVCILVRRTGKKHRHN